jgi:hypothetical protein
MLFLAMIERRRRRVQIGPFAELNYVLDRHVARMRLHTQVTIVGEQHDLAEQANRVVSLSIIQSVINNVSSFERNSQTHSCSTWA